MKAEVYESINRNTVSTLSLMDNIQYSIIHNNDPAMGLSDGGRIDEEIYENDNELEDYSLDSSSRCFVNLINSDR